MPNFESPSTRNVKIEPSLIRVGLGEKFDETLAESDIFDSVERSSLDKEQDKEGRTLAAHLLRKYKGILQNPESQIGQGNHGIVFSLDKDEKSSQGEKCVKCTWDSLTVKGRKSDGTPLKDLRNLPISPPPYIRKLSEIQRYFDLVKGRRKNISKALGSPVSFASQNDPVREVQLSQKARQILGKAKSECRVPLSREVLLLHVEHDSWEGDPTRARYYASERVSMQVMDKVRGHSLEDVIVGYPDEAPLPKNFDVAKFLANLESGLQALRGAGFSHNDITLRNVMVDKEGKPWLIDFGASSENVRESNDEEGFATISRWLKAFAEDPERTKTRLKVEFENLDKKF